MILHPTPVLKESPSQTAGPYVHIGLTPNFGGLTGVVDTDPGAVMVGPETQGQRISIVGRVLDGSGAPVNDAVLELWQADGKGEFGAPGFTGWGRQPTQADGGFRFETIKPGRVQGPDGKPMAPHVSLWIVARGINIGLQTRLYFADEAEANAADFVLNKIMDPRRRETLIASRDGSVYTLDIRLQGEKETVFFDI